MQTKECMGFRLECWRTGKTTEKRRAKLEVYETYTPSLATVYRQEMTRPVNTILADFNETDAF